MTDGRLMDADCVHGVTWYECAECERADLQAAMPEHGSEPPIESLHVLRIDPDHALGCFVCGDHINPILQMTAWGNDLGKWAMGHAKCLWTREGFVNQGWEAPDAE